ncbi:TIGR01777 family oxidoreductase [Silvibacterium dinghuense]|uniref:TIGR01777 family protein n=1 Tax=Silvibacterium dinghuense TaxID=1560006 RepID=A0A4Q1SI10_9BACT|nr:TIGR01777 family oxidoreductase [Silvibacterium dinghuense]RXS97224.1 TIGR01777 family protein [Silvibacterium dinghuense]GGG97240.1 hypothetical protein GCM10011586_10640 [Silvibacterium dinghuense]
MPESQNRILLSGASGLIGTALAQAFTAHGMQTVRLSREKVSDPRQTVLYWDPSAERPVTDLSPLEGLQAAIHLSGANVSSHRWTNSYKQEIVSSRVETTLALGRIFSQLRQPPESFLCASATGIYGNRGDDLLSERSPRGEGFLADTCALWEQAASTAGEATGRVLHLRFGVVLDQSGGALAKMLPLFRAGLGGTFSFGRLPRHLWMSWITLSDLVSALLFLLAPENRHLSGAFNFTAPEPATNADFTHALARRLRRPAILPAPAFALRLVLGPMADETLLASTRAIPEALLTAGYRFQAPDLGTALRLVLPEGER